MKTPDAIKKGLECCIKNSEEACYHCPYMIDCETFDNAGNHSRDALAYINRLEARVQKWISVEDRLPEGVVLVGNFAPGTEGYKKMDVADAFDIGGSDRAFYLFDGFEVGYDVTHWMPLPGLPHEIIQNAPPIENQTPNWISLHDTKPKDGTVAVLLVRNCHCLDVSSFQLSVMRNGEWDLDSPWIPTHYIPLPDEIPRAEDDTND